MSTLAAKLNLTDAQTTIDFDQFAVAAKAALSKHAPLLPEARRRYKLGVEAFFEKRAEFDQATGRLTPFAQIANWSHVSGLDGFRGGTDTDWFQHIKSNAFKVRLGVLDSALSVIIDANRVPANSNLTQAARDDRALNQRIAQHLRKDLGLA